MLECTDTGCYNYSTGECQAPSPLTGLIGGTRGCTAHSSVAGWATCSDTPPHSSLAIYEQEEVLSSTEILTEGAAAWLQAGSLPRAAFNLRAVSINNSVFVTGTD